MLTALFHSEYHDFHAWRPILSRLMPELTVHTVETLENPNEVDVLLTWTPPQNWQAHYPNLRLVHVLAAGVDHLVGQAFPKHIPLVRIIEAQQVQCLFEYLCAGVMYFHREFHLYHKQQTQHRWEPRDPTPAQQRTIGIMGLGSIGKECAIGLSRLGFKVKGWSRTPKEIPDVSTWSGDDQLYPFLAGCDILVCLLPLTDSTRYILNHKLFQQLPPGACLINLGRGAHCVEADLIQAIRDGQLSAALLDVASTEPLPANHPLWNTVGITLTPHVATRVNTENAAQLVVENLRNLIAERPLKGVVDLSQGY